jgi:hypothetical protein
MAWGEHLYWNFETEACAGRDDAHEICGEWPFWDQCYRLAPEASWRFAIGLWDHQIADKKSGDFSRHARYSRHGPQRGSDFPRYAGQMIACWADAYTRKENANRPRRDELVTAIATVVARMERNLAGSENGDLPAGSNPSNQRFSWPGSNLELARCLWIAAPHLDESLAQRMRELALKQDRRFLQLPHRITTGGGFAATMDTTTGKPRSRSMNKPYTADWASGYGHGIHAGLALKCFVRYQQLAADHPDLAARYKPLILAAAGRYLTADPDPNALIKPGPISQVIRLELAAYQLTRDGEYLACAHHFGRLGIRLFLDDESPLPKATNQHPHYETITGGTTFMQTLLQLRGKGR